MKYFQVVHLFVLEEEVFLSGNNVDRNSNMIFQAFRLLLGLGSSYSSYKGIFVYIIYNSTCEFSGLFDSSIYLCPLRCARYG